MEARYLLHPLPVLRGLQVLHKNLRGSEVFFADGAGGDDSSTGKLGTDSNHQDNVNLHLYENASTCEASG